MRRKRETGQADSNGWSIQQASDWSRIPEKSLYEMAVAGTIPCIRLGEAQEQRMPSARSGRRYRRYSRIVIPKAAFVRWFENLEADGSASVAEKAMPAA